MASIRARKLTSGEMNWRIRIEAEKYPYFGLTFDDYEAACDWLKEHEQKYYENPEKYILWRMELLHMMRKKRLQVKDHIVRPRIRCT